MNDRSVYAEKLLIIGLTFLFIAFYFHSQDFFISKSSLIKQNGEVEKSELYYNYVKSSKGSVSTRSELFFKLKSSQSIFVLMENIGNDNTNPRFEELIQDLNISGTVTVWINKSQKEDYRPKVFQIADKNNTMIYTFEESRALAKTGFISSFIIGLIGLVAFFILKYWTRIFKKTPNE
ncbi:hypothetical protein [Flavobacterium sp.]|uniref:hypothetical protein n=1 Tax=Flavobacterium sp. TaxID=239 RepID=UPI004047AFB9